MEEETKQLLRELVVGLSEMTDTLKHLSLRLDEVQSDLRGSYSLQELVPDLLGGKGHTISDLYDKLTDIEATLIDAN